MGMGFVLALDYHVESTIVTAGITGLYFYQ
jgi:hypothetical protein